jgi:DNA-binding transcriptional regulator YhcF (GntR family)
MLADAMTHPPPDKTTSGKKAARQLAGRLREQIERGQIKSGDRILSERQLARRYGQSLHTVRLALGQLKADGILISQPKSGLYVADDAGEKEADRSRQAGPALRSDRRAPAEGFSLLDPSGADPCDLQFLIGSWNAVSHGWWREICHRYSAAPSEVWIEPEFPADAREYRRLLSGADAFISTPMELHKRGRLRPEVRRMDPDELAGAGVEPRYIRAVLDAAGQAIGVPVSACLLVGYLNRRLLPDRLIDPLSSASSWEEVFDLLAEASAHCPTAQPLNFHAVWTFNLHQYLSIAAGGLLDKGRVDLRRTGARKAMERLGRFLQQTGTRPKAGADRAPAESTLAQIEYTCRAAPLSARSPEWLPWRYPLGEGGLYMEGVNLALMSHQTPHRDAARDFLLHLAAPQQQKYLTRSPHEQSISSRVEAPLAAYDPTQAAIFSPMRNQATVFAEWTPGYSRLIDRILPPLSRQWLGGGMSTDEFCRAVEDRGNECLAACQAGEAT